MSTVQKILKDILKDKEPDKAKLDQWMIEELAKEIRAGRISAENPQWEIHADILNKFFMETEIVPLLEWMEKLGIITDLKYDLADLDQGRFEWKENQQVDWKAVADKILKEMPTQGTG